MTGFLDTRPMGRLPMTKARASALLRRLWDMDGPPLTKEERRAELRNWHPPLCAGCGKFTSWDSDNYTNYGNSYDMEPPDPSYVCPRCVAVDICQAMTTGRMPYHWIKASWEHTVAPLIGYALAGSPGAGWADWRKVGEPLPNDWVWR